MAVRTLLVILLSLVLGTAGFAGHWPEPTTTDIDMSVLVREITGIDLVVGGELACIAPNNQVYGLAVVADVGAQIGMSVWGDDGTTPEVDGFETGDTLVFKYWNPNTEEESDVTITELIQGQTKFTPQSFLVCKMAVEESVTNPNLLSPSDFRLSEPYPNPFNSKARLEFNLRSAGFVKLGLYNLNGRLVRDITSGNFSAGVHQLELDGSSLSAGIYLAVISSGANRQAVRAVLLK